MKPRARQRHWRRLQLHKEGLGSVWKGLLFAAVQFGASGAPEAGQQSLANLTVFLGFDDQHSDLSVQEMKREVASILGPAGLRVDWRYLADPREDESYADLAVVRFNGKCQVEGVGLVFSDPGPSGATAALGLTRTSNGQILPYSEVDCNQIRRLIGPALHGAPSREQESALGRALGRVVAHELYHILANTKSHDRCGVAKKSYSPNDLVAGRLEFQPSASKMLREGEIHTLRAAETLPR